MAEFCAEMKLCGAKQALNEKGCVCGINKKKDKNG